MQKTLLATSISILLSACGGGSGSDGSGQEVDDLNTGSFTGSAIAGLTYSTQSQAGTTDANGEYSYKDGETITFSLAGYTLGTADAVTNIDFFTINGAAQPTQRQLNAYHSDILNKGSDAAVNNALNIALLLQSLDEDSDLTNGISINAATAADLADTSYAIKFNIDAHTFQRNLKKVFKQADLEKTPVSPLSTVRHLVNSNVITTPLYRMTGYEIDSNVSGSANKIVAIDYDAQGNTTKKSTDNNGDGTFNSLASYGFDQQGNNSQFSEDNNADGITDKIYSYTYDAQGNKIQQKNYNDVDSVADDVADVIYNFSFDAQGNKLSYEYDGNGDGTATSRYTYVYDALGNKIRTENDSNADGSTNSFSYYSYDEQGNSIQTKIDNNADGNFNYIRTDSFDEQGNNTKTELDINADGEVTLIHTYSYDDLGNRIQLSTDSNGDGSANRTFSYSFDERSNFVMRSDDNNVDGNPEAIRDYTYDGEDNLTDYQLSVNGVLIQGYNNTYDEAGNLIQVDTDSNGDGTVDNTVTYTFEASTVYSYTEAAGNER